MSTDRLPRPRHQDRENPVRGDAQARNGPRHGRRTHEDRSPADGTRRVPATRTPNARGSETSMTGAISDQKPGIAEIEGEFPRRADGARDRTDERPENSVDVEPPRLQVTARIGTAFPATPLLGFRGGRSGRTAMTSGCIRADTPVVGWEVPADRRRYDGPNWRGRFRCLAAARGPVSSGVRH